jgi:hypothetical protein
MGNIGLPEIMVILLVCVVAMIFVLLVPYWKIFGKAGFPPALAFLMFLPLVNIVMLYYLAFSEWPSLRQTPKQGV